MTKTTYNSDDNYECILEMEGGHTFLHLEVYKYNTQVRKELQDNLYKILKTVKDRGEEYLFFYYEKPSVYKLANILKPTVQAPIEMYKDGEVYFLCMWDTGG